MKRGFALAAAIIGVLAAPPVAAAPDGTMATPYGDAASAYSDAELKSFAAAALGVQRIRDIYAPKIAAATDEGESERLRRAAASEMTAEIERHGLSVHRFHDILAAAGSDEALVDRINKHLNEAP